MKNSFVVVFDFVIRFILIWGNDESQLGQNFWLGRFPD